MRWKHNQEVSDISAARLHTKHFRDTLHYLPTNTLLRAGSVEREMGQTRLCATTASCPNSPLVKLTDVEWQFHAFLLGCPHIIVDQKTSQLKIVLAGKRSQQERTYIERGRKRPPSPPVNLLFSHLIVVDCGHSPQYPRHRGLTLKTLSALLLA